MKNLFKFKISAAQERKWENNHILNLKDDYLNNDTFIKYKTDSYILNIGSNTRGELVLIKEDKLQS